jgi:hypothetical protein
MREFDEITKAEHYNSHPANCSKCGHPIECRDVVKHMGFNLGNAIKYIWRCHLKGTPIKDLRKAKEYIDWEIEVRENYK